MSFMTTSASRISSAFQTITRTNTESMWSSSTTSSIKNSHMSSMGTNSENLCLQSAREKAFGPNSFWMALDSQSQERTLLWCLSMKMASSSFTFSEARLWSQVNSTLKFSKSMFRSNLGQKSLTKGLSFKHLAPALCIRITLRPTTTASSFSREWCHFRESIRAWKCAHLTCTDSIQFRCDGIVLRVNRARQLK